MEILNSPDEAANLLLKLDDIVISAHIGPDGDAIGSVSALLLALLKKGKKVCAFLEPFPDKFLNIPGADLIKTKFEEDIKFSAFVTLDCAQKDRLGKYIKYFDKAQITVNIDHHISNNNFADYNFVQSKASATAEIIYEMLTNEENGFFIDSHIATALYAGILSDTGGFRHPSTTPYTYFSAGELAIAGADFSGINKSLFHTRKPEELKVMSIAFSRFQLEFGNKIVWTSINNDDLKQTGATLGELDGIVDYLKSVEGALVAVFFYQKKDGLYKASFRSEPNIDVNAIAEKFGGGGHKNAAGCTLHMPLNECVKAVLKEIEWAIERCN